jgi:hypothetical protein
MSSAILGHMFSSSISPRGTPLEHWVENSRRLELIPTIGYRRRVASDPKVRRLDTLEEMVRDGMGGRNPRSFVASK